MANRYRCVRFAAVAALFYAGGSVLRASEPPDLLAKATRVADVRAWWSADLPQPGYSWLSPTQIFVLPTLPSLESPIEIDVQTQAVTALTGLGKDIAARPHDGVPMWTVSPDGKWFVWAHEFADEVGQAHLDGSAFSTAPLPASGDSVVGLNWDRDDQHWIVERKNDRTGQKTFLCSAEADDAPADAPPIVRPAPNADLNYAEVTGDEAVTLVSSTGSGTVTVHPPHHDMYIQDVALSRDRQKLAWCLLDARTSMVKRWLTRLSPRFGAGSIPAEIWISRRDGHDMHELGVIPLRSYFDLVSMPHLLRWLPSDKKISFVYHDALWTAPVQ